MFEIQLCSFIKDDLGFWFNILSVDNYGDFDRSLFMLGYDGYGWFLELFFVKITPR